MLQYVEPGGEQFLPWAKNKLRLWKQEMLRTDTRVLHRVVYVNGDEVKIFIDSLYLGSGQFRDSIRILSGVAWFRFLAGGLLYRYAQGAIKATSEAYIPTAGNLYQCWQKDKKDNTGTIVQTGDDTATAQDMLVKRGTVSTTVSDVSPAPVSAPAWLNLVSLFASNKGWINRGLSVSRTSMYRSVLKSGASLDPHITVSKDGKTVVALSTTDAETFVVAKYDADAGSTPPVPNWVETRFGLPPAVQAYLDAFTAVSGISIHDNGSAWGQLENTNVVAGSSYVSNNSWNSGTGESVVRRNIRVVPIIHPYSASKVFVAYQFGHTFSFTTVRDNGTAAAYLDEVRTYSGLYEYDTASGVWTAVVDEARVFPMYRAVGGATHVSSDDVSPTLTYTPSGIILLLHIDGTYSVARKALGSFAATSEHQVIYLNGDGPGTTIEVTNDPNFTPSTTEDITVGSDTWYAAVEEHASGTGWSWSAFNIPVQVAKTYAGLYTTGGDTVLRKLTLTGSDTEADRFITTTGIQYLSPTGKWQFAGSTDMVISYLGVEAWDAATAFPDYPSRWTLGLSFEKDGQFVLDLHGAADTVASPDRMVLFKLKLAAGQYEEVVVTEMPLEIATGDTPPATVSVDDFLQALAEEFEEADIVAMAAVDGSDVADWQAAAQSFLDSADATALNAMMMSWFKASLGVGTDQEVVDTLFGEPGHTVDELNASLLSLYTSLAGTGGGGGSSIVPEFMLPEECMSSH